MKMDSKQYKHHVDKTVPKSPIWLNMLKAFVSGGIICIIGQLIFNGLRAININMDNSSAITSIILIFLGAFFTGIGLYDKIAKFAGAGTLVPITGFSNSIVSPAIEFKSEGLVVGIGSKMFALAGPVLVFGILSSVIYGVILVIIKAL